MAGEEETKDAVGVEEPDPEVSDEEAAAGAVDDAEEKTYTQDQFSGLLRDKQASDSARQTAQADAAAVRAQNEELRRQVEDAKKPQETELSEEEANEAPTRAEMRAFGKQIVTEVVKAVKTDEEKTKVTSLKQKQAEDAQALVKSHTVKAKGQGLDAQTVIDQGAAYLQVHHPQLYKAARASPNAASELYRLAITFVPEIRAKEELRRNTELASKLNLEGDNLPPGGGGSGGGSEDGLLMKMLSGELTESEVEAMAG